MSAKYSLVPRDVIDTNVQLDRYLRRAHHMDLKAYKAIKNGLLSLGLLAFGFYIVATTGADPTIVFSGTVAAILVLGGFEIGEFWAAWKEVRQVQAEAQQQNDSSE